MTQMTLFPVPYRRPKHHVRRPDDDLSNAWLKIWKRNDPAWRKSMTDNLKVEVPACPNSRPAGK